MLRTDTPELLLSAGARRVMSYKQQSAKRDSTNSARWPRVKGHLT
jgi:hypothetical protein